MPAGEGGAEVGGRVQLLGDLRQRALLGADVLGQAALRCIAAEERSCAPCEASCFNLSWLTVPA
jgi:hypothetical protein